MGLIKDIYSLSFYNKFADTLSGVVPAFDRKKFLAKAIDNDFKDKEWKDRMAHTTKVLHDFLPADFAKAVSLIRKIITQLRGEGYGEDSLVFMFFPDYIGTYGLEDFENSVKALEFITQFVSCEFAVRPFILKYGNRMIDQMTAWSLHKSHKVRRFASEGSRPRLPWAMAIPFLKKDPATILPLLENLKNDPSEWVRRSVANNLNDIAKDHPQIVLKLAAQWKGISKETDAIIKHGSRTLLKQGHAEILKHYGLESKRIDLVEFEVLTPKVKIGHGLEFRFTVKNKNKEQHKVRLEYGVYYQKSKGHLAKKVFKISERVFEGSEQCTIVRRQSFKLITTRTFYAGAHQVSIILNGKEKGIRDFELTG